MLPSIILITSEALGRCLASKQVHAWYKSAMACGHSSGTLHDAHSHQSPKRAARMLKGKQA